MTSLGRARLLGAAALVAAFAAGVLVGRYLPQREEDGIRVMVKSSTRLPRELDDLGLTDSQRAAIQPILRHGSMRIDSVMRSLFPRIDAAIGATDSEVRVILTPAQRTALDAERAKNPIKVIREKRIVDTVRR